MSAEDRAIWSRVTESVTPRRSSTRDAKPSEAVRQPDTPPETSPVAAPRMPRPQDLPPPPSEMSQRLPTFRIGEQTRPNAPSTHDLVPPISQRLGDMPVHMDRKAFGRMKKGKLVPEARLDLHGMTQDQAHPALTRFIHEGYARQLRLVLVITGKGKDRDEPGPMPVRRGVLKHQVPQWLSSGPMRMLVLQVSEAHLRHGGTGAYYVYLRRPR